MKLKNILFTILLFTLILTACSMPATLEPEATLENQTRESGVLSPVTATPATKKSIETNPEQSKTVKGIQPEDGRIIVYQREGGIAGRSEEWIIYADGTIIDAKGDKQQVDSRLVQAIANMATSTDLQESYKSLNNCCDLFTYTITFYVNGETKRITTVDGAKQPQELTAVLNELGQLLNSLPK